MRAKIVAGNWKMNNDKDATKSLLKDLKKSIKNLPLKNTRVIVAPTFVNLSSALKRTKKTQIEVVAQNMHQSKSGAFTGEISAEMLKSIGVKTVILGHSERRSLFGETDNILAKKVNAALSNNLEIIFCFGEQLEDRKSGNHFKVVESQLKNALFHLEAAAFKNIVLAYEPVWAIGTGETASPEQAQEMHAFIRKVLAEKYNQNTALAVSILYGGSVKPANAEEIFSKPDVDGGLIGGAALKAEDFTAIIKAI
ncbi:MULTISPECIES: triose-phosphate isomerase [Tenacibaculum]|uniref:triose-phosphate isomerase n=1 Tax=Tenacibaculum TaxID=104267 RepID=UPI001F0A9C79|nr:MULTISPECIES: triose-phosphate isomerase [Tenacibaculum]MCH3882821.1 triose-phosphate isomerase [Tenacibaculum aquimarinum]MDO6600469.1 triose-phosphate isomerase [Tenacibaculum sp. 1_MG-2023]